MGTSNSKLTVTAAHIHEICPTAPVWVIGELFMSADAGENSDILNDILTRAGITTAPVIAALLSCSVYDSDGLTQFRGPDGATLTPAEWTWKRAVKWCDLKLNAVAESGKPVDFLKIVQAMGDPDGRGTANLASRIEIYKRARTAFGVENL